MLIAAVATRVSLLLPQYAYSWIAEQLAPVLALQLRRTATELMTIRSCLMSRLYVDRLNLKVNEQLMYDNPVLGATF